MAFRLRFTSGAAKAIDDLRAKNQLKHKKVVKCLGMLERDPAHPGLNSKRYVDPKIGKGKQVWESYVENRTPGAYRVFWEYGPGRMEITILLISAHP